MAFNSPGYGRDAFSNTVPTPQLSYWKKKAAEQINEKHSRAQASNMNQFRGGMQVHSVPEHERAYDAAGTRLPWGYEYSDPDRAQRRIPEERGPFGRSARRRTPSRSKTATPSRTKEDKDAVENWRFIDDIFSKVSKQEDTNKDKSTLAPNAGNALVPVAAADTTTDARAGQTQPQGEPTEVVLRGFQPSFQYAAIEFYERISGGSILEDYDRAPPTTRYDLSLSQSRSRGANSIRLSKEALRKKNSYHGGTHWIKVTFDSAVSADRAMAGSPHVIRGYIVSAELWRGQDLRPDEDKAVPATVENIASATASPGRSSTTLRPFHSPSTTLSSSATPTGTNGTASSALAAKTDQPATPRQDATSATTTTTQSQPRTPPAGGTLRIRNAKEITLLSSSAALLPAKSPLQRAVANVPLVSWVGAGGGSAAATAGAGGPVAGIVGELPRRDDADGAIDWDKAGVYWRFWWCVDQCFGTDFCGAKED